MDELNTRATIVEPRPSFNVANSIDAIALSVLVVGLLKYLGVL